MRRRSIVAVAVQRERRRAARKERPRGGRAYGLFVAALSAGLVLVTFLSGCTRSAGEGGASKLDSGMRRLAASRPDSVVGVLVRVIEPLSPARRDSLKSAGLAVETQAGSVVTGTLRAGSAPAVARLPFVERLELARQVRVHRSTS